MNKLFTTTILSRQDVTKTLQGDDGPLADFVLGVTAFTANVITEKEQQEHRFAVVLLSDVKTGEHLSLPDEVARAVIAGSLDRFRDLLYGVWGEEQVQAMIMQSLVEQFGTEEDGEDEETTPVLR